MQPQILAFIIIAVTIVIIVVATLLIIQKRVGIFKEYIKKQFPDISEKEQVFRAKRTVTSLANDIVLIINEAKKELIVFLVDDKEISHKVYPFKDLTSVKSSDRIIRTGYGKGVMPAYNYERTMSLEFSNGSKYAFILIKLSNEYGNDQWSNDVRNAFAPWEEKLKKITV